MTAQTALALEPVFRRHIPSPEHPESVNRYDAIHAILQAEGLTTECIPVPVTPASDDVICLIHSPEYLTRIEEACKSGQSTVDSPDVEICIDSAMVARSAVGACCNAIDLICRNQVKNAFIAARPPGHHAEKDRAMGFCLFNSASIAARYAQETYAINKVFILDWDVHHGNGTQHIFDDDPTIYYCSLHTHPAVYYPGTGYADEIGSDAGRGFTLNLPLEPNTSERDYISIFEKSVLPAFEVFNPDLLIISAGFDAHQADPIGNQLLTTESFRTLTRLTRDVADSICGGKVLSVLEGGYDTDALARSVSVHLTSLVGA